MSRVGKGNGYIWMLVDEKLSIGTENISSDCNDYKFEIILKKKKEIIEMCRIYKYRSK